MEMSSSENVECKSEVKEKYVKNVKKATMEHKQLAEYIKKIHSQLRNESKLHGMSFAWEKHVAQNETLKTYAESMYQLATQHWKNSDKTYCRIEWIKSHCREYFFNGGRTKYDNQEMVQKTKSTTDLRIKVLDVGSCYNPFNNEDNFDVIAIDIAPYSKDVIKCDFLNMNIDDKINSFDVIIFSLFLEYIPCPEQRFLCCEKAFKLLNDGGVLFIVTPDSKHAGANTKIINTSWKIVLSKLGFLRIRYEKLQHIHCLMFRKCYDPEFPDRKINRKKISDDICFSKIYIPQDFQKDLEKGQKVEYNAEEIVTLFDELPCVE